MSVYRKVKAVEKLFAELERAMDGFKAATGLGCLPGCGECCKKPDIEAVPLEFLPLAYSLYKAGTAWEWLEKLGSEDGKTGICTMFTVISPTTQVGRCTVYPHRGLICRLFGFSAVTDKHGQARLSTCRIIKTETAGAFWAAEQHIAAGGQVPMVRNYYQQLASIDFALAQEPCPINTAIKQAIEAVLAYYAYRGRRAS